MAVIIQEMEIETLPAETRSKDPTRPNGEAPRGEAEPPSPRDLLDVVAWSESRERRLRAH